MTNKKKYTIFVLVVSLCYLAFPYFFTAGEGRNAERTVTLFALGLVAELFYVFYLDILLIVIPLTYMLLKTKIISNKLNVNALALLLVFFAVVYRGNLVCYNRFSHDLVSGYNTLAAVRAMRITNGADITLSNFAAYTYNMPMAYLRMNEGMRDAVWHYLPGLTLRVLLSLLIVVLILSVFIWKYFSVIKRQQE